MRFMDFFFFQTNDLTIYECPHIKCALQYCITINKCKHISKYYHKTIVCQFYLNGNFEFYSIQWIFRYILHNVCYKANLLLFKQRTFQTIAYMFGVNKNI
jgi:hypothetical protein